MQDKEHETENVEFLYASSFLYELGQNIYHCAPISTKQNV